MASSLQIFSCLILTILPNLRAVYTHELTEKYYARGVESYFGPNKRQDLMSHSSLKRKNESAISAFNIYQDVNTRSRRSVRGVTITQHFVEKTTTQGSDVSLSCIATSQQPPKFEWERDGVIISSNMDHRYILGQVISSEGTVTSQLNISRLRVDDGGLYTCRAIAGDITTYHSDRLNVYGPPYIRNTPPLKVQSGEPVEVKCPYYGFPVSSVDWEFKGEKVAKRYKRNSAIVKGDGVLRIPKVSSEEDGTQYTCVVTTQSGEMARRTFEINVIEGPQLDELLMGSNLQEGQIVQITCNIRSGDTPVYFSWLKDGKKIPSSLKVEERSSELFSVLVIKKVSLEHCGTYTCIAANHAAKVNRSAELYIKVAPKWITEPTNTSLLFGERGSIDCSASGYPQPQVHWMKKDESSGTWRPVLELTDGGALSLPNGSLVISRVSSSDAGQYSCGVENGVGQPLNKNIWITVNKPAHFTSASSAISSRSGHPTTLICTPCGDLPLRVTWTKEDRPLDYMAPRMKMTESKSEKCLQSSLVVEYTQASDAGQYRCKATNPYGVDTHTMYLTVQEPPTPPSQLSVWQTKSRSAQITWTQQRKDEHVTHYTVTYTVLDTTLARSVNVTRSLGDIRQGMELKDLKPSTGYSVRIAAANDVDISGFTPPVIFNTLEEAPSSSPTNVVAIQTENPGELLVSWMPPSKESHNGILLGYYVKAQPQDGTMNVPEDSFVRSIKATSQNNKQETLLTGLKKNTRYAVSICAYNSAGKGPYSMPIYQDTREGAPEEAPSNLECTSVSSTSLKVFWHPIPPDDQGGSLLGYYVFFANEDDGTWHNITTVQSEIYLQGLYKYMNYTIKVAGFSNYGQGPKTYPVFCTTLPDVPGPPAASKVIVSSATSLIVSWKRPERPNGIIIHYNVYAKTSESSSDQASPIRVPAPEDHREWKTMFHEISGLTQNKLYDVWVTAFSRSGESAPTAVMTVATTNRIKAGIWTLGGLVHVRGRTGVTLPCAARGTPRPRAVWQLGSKPLPQNRRFTTSDLALIIHDPDESLSGNYTCIAKNHYGTDSVTYIVDIPPLPDTPVLSATASRNSITIEWEEAKQHRNRSYGYSISYALTWREQNGDWQDTSSNDFIVNGKSYRHVLDNLRCGTKYTVRITATNKVGSSQPGYLDVATLGGVPKAPSTTDWFWSNSSHIVIHLSGWDDNQCEISQWIVDYRQIDTQIWLRAENKFSYSDQRGWSSLSNMYQMGTTVVPKSFAIADLSPAKWYQVKVSAHNEAGTSISVYSYATKTINGQEIGPPSERLDLSIAVIVCSSILLLMCLIFCIFIGVKKTRHNRLTEYRSSIDYKSESGNNLSAHAQPNMAVTTGAGPLANCVQKERVYSTPINVRKNNKNEMYEISPYAQFTVGFRTFGHSENQGQPTFTKDKQNCYSTETSFQVCSESEDSDSISKPTTLKSLAGKGCRLPHHR